MKSNAHRSNVATITPRLAKQITATVTTIALALIPVLCGHRDASGEQQTVVVIVTGHTPT